jgi:competence protein ComEC
LQLQYSIPVYKTAPFIRLLLALSIGIIAQWYGGSHYFFILFIVGGLFMASLILYWVLPHKPITKIQIKGIALQLLFVALGCALVYINDIRNNPSFAANKMQGNYKTIISLNEPLSEKTKTYKAIATIRAIIHDDTVEQVVGNTIVYIKKDSSLPALHYGCALLLNKPLQPIKNNGNPGSFNYQQQTLFKNITHQVFLSNTDYIVLPYSYKNGLDKFLFNLRDKVLGILDQNIKSKKEKSVAEALLIGYRDDLDKDLVQAYSNTGTIHVIAISGLHLGFIYLLLLMAFKPFAKIKWIHYWLKPIVVIGILWIFSLLAGGGASILRSAIMFTCIAVGEIFNKKNSIYNSLALSAFIILCIYPFSLWDVGFQLSYAAVLSIVVFMQPIYQLFYFKNKILNGLWKLNAVTLSAQILTIPITIYHFHQFPNLFLITNLIAVPLSSIILGGELLLLVISWWKPVALFVGKLLTWGIWVMDSYIEWCNGFSFAITDYLQMTSLQCFSLFAVLIAFSYWLLKKYKPAFIWGLALSVWYIALSIYYQYPVWQRHQLVVYNVPNQKAIDIITNDCYHFIGDSILTEDGFLKNFHLKPARIASYTHTANAPYPYANAPFYSIANKHILLVEKAYTYHITDSFKNIDVLVLSKNPKVYLEKLTKIFTIKQVVADASNPAWKVKLWQKDCERLQIPFYNTAEQGAFIQNL